MTALADTCENDTHNWDSSLTPEECATIGSSIALGTESGIYSAKKYKDEKIFEEKNTTVLLEQSPKILQS